MSKNPLYTRKVSKFPLDLQPKVIRHGPLINGRSPMETYRNPLNPPKEFGNDREMLERIVENTTIMVATSVIERGLIGRNLSITTSPTRVIDGKFLRGYILLNQSTVSGALTLSGTTLVSATRLALATGNTQADPIGVGNYREMKLFLDISATTGGTVAIDLVSQDPVSLNWVVTQSDIFGSESAVGTYYADVGTLGIDNAFAINFTIGAGGESTFSVGHILKDGLSGSSSGLANTIYLGGINVRSSTGFPLLEGQKESYYARPNAELYAVSLVSDGVTLSIFDLQ